MAVATPLNLIAIRQGIRGLGIAVTRAQVSANRSAGILINRTKIKSKLVFGDRRFFQKRRDSVRRKRQEEMIESSTVGGALRSGATSIANSARGFLGRIMDFLGTLLLGWMLNNLPTIISMAQELMGRIQRLVSILGSFVTNIGKSLLSFGNVLGAIAQNIATFDFLDTSKRVESAMSELGSVFDDMGREIDEGMKLLKTPLTEGLATGEDAAPFGTDYTTQPTGEESTTGGPEISGGRVSPQAVYSYLRQKGISHIHAMGILANIEGESGFQIGAQEKGGSKQGVGLFQYTFPSRKQAFLQAVPDYKTNWKGQIDFAMGQDPNTPIYLRKQFASPEQAADDFMRNWENPNKRVYAERRRKHNQFIKSFKPGSTSQQVPQQTPSSPTPTPTPSGEYFKPLPQGSYKGGAGQRFGASRDGGKRKHLGLDITESNWKPGSDPRIPVVAIRGGVVSSRHYVGGEKYLSGLVIDQDDGYSVRYLHMSPSVRPGQNVAAGQRIGRLVNLGNQTHLHIELYSGSKLLDPTSYITSVEKGVTPRSIAPAQIATRPTQRQQLPGQITPERRGPQVVLIDDTPPPMPQIPSAPSSGMMLPMVAGDPLNSFIKNKLLLDLAYT